LRRRRAQVPREENLAMVSDSVRYLKAAGKEVMIDLEHFFDGFKANPT
jgi:2-isopropylmalate synthase